MGISFKIEDVVFTNYITKMGKSLRFYETIEFSESGSLMETYTYSLVSPNSSTSIANTCNRKIAASTDGAVYCKIDRIAGRLIFMVAPTNDKLSYLGVLAAIWVETLTAPVYKVSAGAGLITCNLIVDHPYTKDDVIRLRRTNGYWFAEVSKDDGITYDTIHAFSIASYGDAFPALDASNANTVGSVSELRGENTVEV